VVLEVELVVEELDVEEVLELVVEGGSVVEVDVVELVVDRPPSSMSPTVTQW
jgi:hypothetical protein